MGERHFQLDLPTKLLVAAVSVAAVLTALPGSAEESSASATPGYLAQVLGTAEPEAIPDQYIVVLKAPPTGEDNAVLDAAVDRAEDRGAEITQEYGDALNGYAAQMSATELVKARQDPAVAYIVADQVVSINGSRSVDSWGQDRIDQRSGLNGKLVTSGDGTGVTVYVIDTGVRSTHTDLAGRVLAGYNTVDDGNGTEDCVGHGTHVAGTIGGSAYGVAPGVKIVPVRVLACDGSGQSSDVIAGINWVTANASGPSVANMSLGGESNAALDNAVNASIASGITYAVAAGNEKGADACTKSPARVPNTITVAASTNADANASFSNLGSCVDLYGPGQSIVSDWYTSNTATATLSGTSMAAPHVAGAVALHLQAHPDASPDDVTSALLAAATSGALTGVPSGTPNLLLYVGSAGTVTPTPVATTTTPATTPATTPTATPTTQPTLTSPVPSPTATGTPTPTSTSTPTPTTTRPAVTCATTTTGKVTPKTRALTVSTYTSRKSGVHSGCLSGPKATDFDLTLSKWNGKRWVVVKSSSKAGSSESIRYTGIPGKYRWSVEREKGKGSYTLRISHPA